jgi:hypothetical protein
VGVFFSFSGGRGLHGLKGRRWEVRRLRGRGDRARPAWGSLWDHVGSVSKTIRLRDTWVLRVHPDDQTGSYAILMGPRSRRGNATNLPYETPNRAEEVTGNRMKGEDLGSSVGSRTDMAKGSSRTG